MDDLVAFLTARLDEREALARAAVEGDGRWRYSEGGGDVMLVDGGYVAVGPWGCDIGESYGRHIAANDPAYVLADIAAKRRIILVHQSLFSPEGPPVHLGLRAQCRACSEAVETWPCSTLRLLSLPYVDHPDYREGWKP